MWPWDWVTALGSGIAGISQKIVDWVGQQIAAVMSWVTSAITDIWNTIDQIYQDIRNLWDQIVNFVTTLVGSVVAWTEHFIQSILEWVGQQFTYLASYLSDAIRWITDTIRQIYNYVGGWVQSVIRWVHDDIYMPLYRFVNDVLTFARTWIARIWQYFEHPELLINLIGSSLWSLWSRYVVRYGAAVARWLLRRMVGLAGEVFDMLETIISAII